jgi:hypothetical protein
MHFSQVVMNSRSHQIIDLAKVVQSKAAQQRAHIPPQPTPGDIPGNWTQNFMAPGRPLTPRTLLPMGSLQTSRQQSYINDPAREPRNAARILEAKPSGLDAQGRTVYSIRTDNEELQFTPRSYQYPPSVNTTITPRVSYGLMPFADIQNLSWNTPDVMLCPKLLKREFSGLVPRVVHKDGDTCEDTKLATLANYPDGYHSMSTWLSRWFFNAVVYDGACLHMVRDTSGHIIAMTNIDASTMFPIIDENGNPPAPPAPAFLQVIYGTPFGFASTEQVWYRPNDLQISSPYGTALVESANLPAMLLWNIWRYQAAWFTVGTLPEYVVTAPVGWSNEQIAQWLITKSDALAGHPELRAQFDVWPNGFQNLVTKSVEFRKEIFDLAKREVMVHAGIPVSEIGETQRFGLGGRGFMDAMGQAVFRQAFLPWMRFTASPFNDAMKINSVKCDTGHVTHEIEWDFPTQSIDPEKQAKRVREQWESGAITWGEYREAIGQNRFGDERDDLVYIAKGAVLLKPDGSPYAVAVQVVDMDPAAYQVPGMDPDAAHAQAQEGQVPQAGQPGQPVAPAEVVDQKKPGKPKPGAKVKPGAKEVKPGAKGAKPKGANPVRERIPADDHAAAKEKLKKFDDADVDEWLDAELIDALKKAAGVSEAECREVGEQLNVDWMHYSFEEWCKGMQEELEHQDVTGGDLVATGKIVLAHLNERWDYYSRLEPAMKLCGVDPSDDLYYGAPILQEVIAEAPVQGANNTEVVAVRPSGREPRAFAWKAGGEEDDTLTARIGHPQYVAEEACYLLDRALNFMLVPVSFVAESNDEKGAAIHWVLNSGQPVHADEYAPMWIEKAAALDFIAGQADRTHDPHKLNLNYLTHPDDPTRPVLIDNGLSFPTPDSTLTLASDFVNAWGVKPFGLEVTAALNAVQDNLVLWKRIGNLVGQPAADLAKARLDQIVHDGQLPPTAETSQRTGG